MGVEQPALEVHPGGAGALNPLRLGDLFFAGSMWHQRETERGILVVGEEKLVE
jgi:hypothetical protein